MAIVLPKQDFLQFPQSITPITSTLLIDMVAPYFEYPCFWKYQPISRPSYPHSPQFPSHPSPPFPIGSPDLFPILYIPIGGSPLFLI